MEIIKKNFWIPFIIHLFIQSFFFFLGGGGGIYRYFDPEPWSRIPWSESPSLPKPTLGTRPKPKKYYKHNSTIKASYQNKQPVIKPRFDSQNKQITIQKQDADKRSRAQNKQPAKDFSEPKTSKPIHLGRQQTALLWSGRYLSGKGVPERRPDFEGCLYKNITEPCFFFLLVDFSSNHRTSQNPVV